MKVPLHRLEDGDLVLTMLVRVLRQLRDQLARDGLFLAADLVADLVEITDDYLARDLLEDDGY